MDNLTHSLFGLTLARTPLGRAGRGTTAALLLASNVPDIDVIVTVGGAARYLELHRGPTHGPLGLIGLSLVVATLVRLWYRWRGEADDAAGLLTLWGLGMVGVLGHVLMDLPTSYGTRPLSPFSWTWFTVDWMPIVDIYLLAMLGAGLWFGRGSGPDRRVQRRWNAAIVLVLMAANYGVRAATHAMAIERAPIAFGDRLPGWCADAVHPIWGLDRWPQPGGSDPRTTAAARCLVELAAMPDFISPFRWRLIAHLSNGYEVRDVDLLSASRVRSGEAATRRSLAVRVPNHWTPAVMQAARAPVARVFLGFSRFPAARSLVDEGGTATVRWNDVRFMQGPMDDPRLVRSGLFTATVVLSPDGRIVSDRLGP